MEYRKAVQSAKAMLANAFDAIDIVIAAHVIGPRGCDNTIQMNCPETEHFTAREFREIYTGIVDAGFFVRKVFYSEYDLVKDILSEPNAYSSTVVFNLCRNGSGMNKKTAIPAVCDLLGVAFTSSSAGICALARNKWLFTSYLSSNGVACPVSGLSARALEGRLRPDALVIRKPNGGSASQGINYGSILPLNEMIGSDDGSALIQQYVDGYECETPVFCSSGQCFAMPPVGISFGPGELMGILTYDSSLANDYGFYDASDILCQEKSDAIRADAVRSFLLLGLEKYGRVDFRIDKNTYRHYVTDISTTPYITKHSSFAYAARKSGGGYPDIFRLIIAAALYQKTLHNDRNC